MKIVMASDIFGECETHSELYSRLARHHSVIRVTPYEQQAYQSFLMSGGMTAYMKKLEYIANNQDVDVLIGFSAGGAALWATQNQFDGCKHAIAFYPGQIREFLTVENTVSWDLIFACEEAHFDQTPVLQHLANKANVNVSLTPYHHGFINQRSTHFEKSASEIILTHLETFLLTPENTSFFGTLSKMCEKFGKSLHAD